ncbi:MAG: elongation factor P [Bacteriovorax sp.]|nr:elongation factor P [Bacteriovorax sp.]
MIDTTEMKRGLKMELEGKPYIVLKSEFTNPGKGSAFVIVRIKNLETGQVMERTFKSGVSTNAEIPDLEEKEVEYMYADVDGFNFMDQANFESIHLTTEQVGDDKFFLMEGSKLTVLYYKGRPISIEHPHFVNLKVTETDPGLKGDTASGATKKAVMETGLQVRVPLFIKEGELLKIDTREGAYVERATVTK